MKKSLCSRLLTCCLPLMLAVLSSVVQAKILVIAPHPDDDLLMAAGVTQAAIARAEPVQVVYMTNGDAYSVDSDIYGSGVNLGYTREAEAVAGQSYLGNSENNLIFLGYPDAGLEDIYYNYPGSTDTYTTDFGQSTTYGNRGLGRKDYHSYKFGSPAKYNLYNMVMDLKQIITDFRPDHIITTAEFDQHADHATTYLVLEQALNAVLASSPGYTPTVHETVIHADYPDWPEPMDPTNYHTQPPTLGGTTLNWADRESLDVPLLMQSSNYDENPKYQAVDAHQSQGGATDLLAAMIHKDEFFWIDTSLGGSNHAPMANAGVDQSVAQGAQVTLAGAGSRDFDGDGLNYAWVQTSGLPVQLTGAATAAPSFIAPTGLTQDVQLVFRLVTNDGNLSSLPDSLIVTVTGPVGTNIAPQASITASSQSSATSQLATKAADGVIAGYPGDYTKEWATTGQGQGAWIRFTWTSARTINRVVLYDRPNADDNITGGTLSFSDGSSISVGALNNSGSGYVVSFSDKTVTSVTFTVNSVSSSTLNVGLAEVQIYSNSQALNQPPVANAGVDQTVSGGSVVTLNGSGSYDPEGGALIYAWAQTSGPTVALSNSAAVSPTFTAPTGLTQNASLTFELVVQDNQSSFAVDAVTITVQAGTSSNIASLASITASSQSTATGQLATKAVDGVIDGYPGDYSREWATTGQGQGAWIRFTWPSAHTVNRVVLYDRPNSNDYITGGTLSFSDGTSINVGALNNNGTGYEVSFTAKTISSLTFTINSVAASTLNVGLAEVQVYEGSSTPVNHAPVANAGADQTVAQGTAVSLNGGGSYDPDGDALTYQWQQTSGTTVQLSSSTAANPSFTAPTGLTQDESLTFELVVRDGLLSSAVDSVMVTVQATAASNIAPSASIVASTQSVATGQLATKAADGVIDGWPGDYSREWATTGEGQGAWIRFTWPTARTVNRVVLYDRPNLDDYITGGTLSFSDGSSISVGALNNSGAGLEVSFGAKTITSLTFTVNSVSAGTLNIGLAEIQIFAMP